MVAIILGLILGLALLVLSFYILLLKKNIRIAVLALGIAVVIPMLAVTANCIRDSNSDSCSRGKAHLPYYILSSTITIAPLLYLLTTAAIYYKHKRTRAQRYRRRSNKDEVVKFNSNKLTHIDRDGKIKSIRWQSIDEIRVAKSPSPTAGKDLVWIFIGRNKTKQVRIGNEARGMEQLIPHIQRMPGFDSDSFKMASAASVDVNFLIWIRG